MAWQREARSTQLANVSVRVTGPACFEFRRESRGNHGGSHQGNQGRTHQGNQGRTHQGNQGRTHQGNQGRTHQGNQGRTHQGNQGRTHQWNQGRIHQGNQGRTHQGNQGRTHQGNQGRTHLGNHQVHQVVGPKLLYQLVRADLWYRGWSQIPTGGVWLNPRSAEDSGSTGLFLWILNPPEHCRDLSYSVHVSFRALDVVLVPAGRGSCVTHRPKSFQHGKQQEMCVQQHPN